MEIKPDPQDMKNIVLNCKVPYLIRGLTIPWKNFDINFEDWCALFDQNSGSDGIIFETGSSTYYDEPQWERTRGSKKMTASKFLDEAKNSNVSQHWNYFGYKDIENCPECCKEGVDYSFLGFPEIKNDISFWMGSVGAHTPLHYDSYGINVVVQVYGRKSWLLFPPDTDLQKTRIPYEESSVYCKQNFFSPSDVQKFKNISNKGFHLIMQPGDVLIVPQKWWHYVENLEPALNFNSWIKLEADTGSQMDECIVIILIKQFLQYLDESSKRIIINPNELSNFESYSEETSLLTTLNFLISSSQESMSNCFKKLKTNKYPNSYLSEVDYTKLLIKCSYYISPVKLISTDEFTNIMTENSKRYDPSFEKEVISEECKHLSSFINSVCNPQTISLIRDRYINELQQND